MNTREKISYGELCKDFDMVLCNNDSKVDEYWYDHIINRPEQAEDKEEELDILESVYQTFIIGQRDAEYLCRWTDQLVGYNPVLDVFVWHITHFGTSWTHVFTEKYTEPKEVDLSELTKHIE